MLALYPSRVCSNALLDADRLELLHAANTLGSFEQNIDRDHETFVANVS